MKRYSFFNVIMVLIALLLIGIAFIAGASIYEKDDVSIKSNSQLVGKIVELIDKAIEKIDTGIEKAIDAIVKKLPEKVKKIGKVYLREGWNKLKKSFLKKIGAQ